MKIKTFKELYLIMLLPLTLFFGCVEEQDDLTYDGPSVAEFKNNYLEQQARLGTASFQSLNYNIVTLENTTLNRLTVRQPAIVLRGVVTSALNSAIVTGQISGTFTASVASNVLTVTSVPSGGVLLGPGVEITGAGIPANTFISSVFNAPAFTTGTYLLNRSLAVASTTLSTASTQFTTQLEPGSILKSATGVVLGVVSTITNDNSLTLTSNAATALTRSGIRGSFALGVSAPAFRDSILVQLVGRQVASDITVSYIKDFASPLTPAGAIEAIEGVHYNLVRNNAGELVIKGNSSSGYIYIDVLESLSASEPDRVTLMLSLTDQGDIIPSQNYKTFTYNIIK